VRFLEIDFNEDVIAFDLDWIRIDWLKSRHTECSARTHIETGTVAWATDLIIAKPAAPERGTIMGTDILDSVIFTLNVKEEEGYTIQVELFFLSRG
jgi:hypothetical protein